MPISCAEAHSLCVPIVRVDKVLPAAGRVRAVAGVDLIYSGPTDHCVVAPPPSIAPPDLQEILWNKEAKVSSYRRHCREVWLLIVARGLEPSTFGDLGPEIEGHQFKSSFDRVFLLNYSDGIVTELHVRPAP